MKILVLQARRTDDPMMEQEQRCFYSATGLPPETFEFVNLVDRVPGYDDLQRCDALMVGGAGHYSVVERNGGFFSATDELLRRVVADGFPTYASCFGYQLMVAALGGKVVHDPDKTEVGAYTVRLTDDGRRDSLFRQLPDEFVAQMGHMDRARNMPPGLVNLAASEQSPLQALRVPGLPVWASQFHPELDQQANWERYQTYIERYDPVGFNDGDGSFVSLPSPETSTLLPAFLELIRNG
jgi:GMP synthase (glutamine-hydrolysing)